MTTFRLQKCWKEGSFVALQSTQLSHRIHTAAPFLKVKKMANTNQNKSLYVSAAKAYPSAPTIPLPANMIQIFGNETGRFTPERTRDITGPVLFCQSDVSSCYLEVGYRPYDMGFSSTIGSSDDDSHADSYDCTGTVSLNSSMQSNVPQPFSSEGKAMHLNMPGGQWGRDDKYIADDMQNSHYARVDHESTRRLDRKDAGGNIIARCSLAKNVQGFIMRSDAMRYSTDAGTTSNDSRKPSPKESPSNSQSAAAKLKRAVKDYGSTVVVFHVGLSLASLGICYVVISSGIDVPALVHSLGFVDDEKIQNLLSNSSTFVIAYAVHKLFAPARISVTLATTPFLVRYLRKVGILKSK